MRSPLLTKEERLRRLRKRWAKQCAERRQERKESRARNNGRAHKLTAGVREYRERLISPAMMLVAERYFFGKRGLTPRPSTTGGILA